MQGVSSEGKIVLVNKDFTIRVPYGAGYELGGANGDDEVVLAVTRFEELPENYANGTFRPPVEHQKRDVLRFCRVPELDDAPRGWSGFPDFLESLKRSTDERFARAAVGEIGEGGESVRYRALKVSQDTDELKVGYVTTDLFVSVNFVAFVHAGGRMYRGTMKVERSAQKFKRSEMFMKAMLSSVRANTAASAG